MTWEIDPGDHGEAPRLRPGTESLEERCLLSGIWTGGGDGVNWTDNKNWSDNESP